MQKLIFFFTLPVVTDKKLQRSLNVTPVSALTETGNLKKKKKKLSSKEDNSSTKRS